jgi:hypothetical protein
LLGVGLALLLGGLFAGFALGGPPAPGQRPEPTGNTAQASRAALWLQRDQQREAARRQPQPPKNPNAVRAPAANDAWPSGIINDGGPAPLPAELFVTHNMWQDVIDGQHVSVYAGSERADPSQGMLVVFITSLDLQSHRSETYRTPAKRGALRVVGTDGLRLKLSAASGGTVVFDVATRQFGS